MEKNQLKHLRVTEDTHRKVKILATTLGLTINQLINKLISVHEEKERAK